MPARPTIGVVRGFLPSCFPDRHGVFEACEVALAADPARLDRGNKAVYEVALELTASL
ncbi:MAG: hypothetical protein ACTS3R_11360 [Inquilinaceae bacterium]